MAAAFAGQMEAGSRVVIAPRFIDFALKRFGWDTSVLNLEGSVAVRHFRLIATSLSLFSSGSQRQKFSHFLGYSVGQFAALASMGLLDEYLALELVVLRAQCLEEAWRKSPSKMLTIVGVPDCEIEKVVSRYKGRAFVSARNSKMNTSVGVDLNVSSEVEKEFAELRPIKIIEQPSCGAWHTPFMRAAADEFRPVLEQKLVMGSGRGYFIEHTAGQIHLAGDMTREWLVDNLLSSIMSPVECRAMFETLRGKGVLIVTEFGLSPFLVKIVPFISREFRATFSE